MVMISILSYLLAWAGFGMRFNSQVQVFIEIASISKYNKNVKESKIIREPWRISIFFIILSMVAPSGIENFKKFPIPISEIHLKKI